MEELSSLKNIGKEIERKLKTKGFKSIFKPIERLKITI